MQQPDGQLVGRHFRHPTVTLRPNERLLLRGPRLDTDAPRAAAQADLLEQRGGRQVRQRETSAGRVTCR